MGEIVGNFSFLEAHSPQLSKLGRLAERYFSDDPPSALIKLRQFAEITAKDVAARQALLPRQQITFDEVLRALRTNSILQREVADLFYHLKRVGNVAAHEDRGSAADALTALKIARAIGIWFYQTYGNAAGFKPRPFIPPSPPPDTSAALAKELSRLKQEVAVSADAQAKAQLAAQEAEADRRRLSDQADTEAKERAFWEKYATETEAALRTAERALAEKQAHAEAAPAQQLMLLAQSAVEGAERIEIDEATTRVLIDEQLRSAGWEVDSAVLRYANGARPDSGRPIAISEWPTESGPVDYALFIAGRCVGVVEAKRQLRDVPGRIGQAKRYARDITLAQDQTLDGAPWGEWGDQFKVPFVFVTNGRPYVKQLATKSGTWFWDARRNNSTPRALSEWFSPRSAGAA